MCDNIMHYSGGVRLCSNDRCQRLIIKEPTSGLQKSSQYAKDQIDEFHDEKIAVCFLRFTILLVSSWCSFMTYYSLISCKQNLLASGVQSDSDMEELDDEVKACFFEFWFCL